MTLALPDPADALDDAELAVAAARGDRSAFAEIYDRYADRLYDFCAGMLRDRDAAADCVQDVFVAAATQLDTLREPNRLRSWLYAIARHQALARIKARRREMPSDDLPEFDSGEPDMVTIAARTELAELIAEACGGLSDRDRQVFELTYRHGLDGGELAAALGVSHTNANTMSARLRDGVERSLGALLLCRGAKADPASCPDLSAIVEGWDGTFTVLMRKRAARHIDSCPVCDEERQRRVNPVALLGSVPVFLPAPESMREHTLTGASKVLPPDPRANGSATKARVRYRRAAMMTVLVVLGIGGVAQVAAPLWSQDYRTDQVTELGDVQSASPGTVTALTAPPPSVPSSAAPTMTGSSVPPRTTTTTAIVVEPTLTTQPTRSTTRTTAAPTTRSNSSFSPSRAPESSATRTTQSSTSTSTPTSRTSTSSSSSSSSTATTTTTSSDPIE